MICRRGALQWGASFSPAVGPARLRTGIVRPTSPPPERRIGLWRLWLFWRIFSRRENSRYLHFLLGSEESQPLGRTDLFFSVGLLLYGQSRLRSAFPTSRQKTARYGAPSGPSPGRIPKSHSLSGRQFCGVPDFPSPSQNCHPDRSVAKWRDPLFCYFSRRLFSPSFFQDVRRPSGSLPVRFICRSRNAGVRLRLPRAVPRQRLGY